jgi:hypothetical protein
MTVRPMTIPPRAAASGCLGSSKAPTLMHCPLLPIPAVAWLARYAPIVWPANFGRALPAKNHDTHVDQKSYRVSGKSVNLAAIESKNAVLLTQARAKPACAAAKSPRADSALSKKGSQFERSRPSAARACLFTSRRGRGGLLWATHSLALVVWLVVAVATGYV